MKKTVLILSLALGTIGVLGILYAKKLTTESSEKALKTEAESLFVWYSRWKLRQSFQKLKTPWPFLLLPVKQDLKTLMRRWPISKHQEALQLIYDEKLALDDEEEKEEPKENVTEEEGVTSSVSEPPVVDLKDHQDGEVSPSKVTETLMYFSAASLVALFAGYMVSTYIQPQDDGIEA